MRIQRISIKKMKQQRQRQLGFTLLEMLMAMVILGAAAAGVFLPFVSAAQVQREAVCQVLAAQLASNLMEEIVSMSFDEIRTRWDGYTEAEGQVKNASGTVFSDPIYGGFARSVSVGTVQINDTECLMASVRVDYKGRQMVRLQSLIAP